MRAALLSVFLAVSLTVPAAHADEVYKWVDKNGVVHYGEFPPNNKKSKTIETPSRPEPPAEEQTQGNESDGQAAAETAAPATEAPKANTRDKFLEDRQKQKEEKERAERLKKEQLRACNEAKSNVASLEGGGKIRMLDEMGNSKILTPEEIQQRLAEEKKNVAKYCKK